ncbi:hypothetical protein ACL02S_20710 [Nocardia sp. 004]|uniref:hypothetical protein n=1 Tax=Nocardia sp. 004 TaxID=3385978 RepID=UPI0039A3786F
MELDQIRTLAGQLAARFGIQPPPVESGKVPKWSLDGLWARRRKGQPVLLVGSAFNNYLSPAEQEGALAAAVVSLDLVKTRRRKFLITSYFSLLAVGMILVFAGGLFRRTHNIDVPSWLLPALIGGGFAISYYMTIAVWLRRIIYHTDRRVAELMGRPVIDMLLNIDNRGQPQPRILVAAFLMIVVPSKTQRIKRLDMLEPQTESSIAR